MANASVTLDPASTPENPIFNFVVPQGEKGDPGGIVLGTLLNNTHDLNTVIVPGTYYWSNTSTPLNAPGSFSSNMVVYAAVANNTNTQIVYPRSSLSLGNTFKLRSVTNSVWDSWKSFNSTRTDQTAGRAIYQWDDLNNREQRSYSDTGWRDISPLLVNGCTATTFRIRRRDDDVEISFTGLKLPTSATLTDNIVTTPPGFGIFSTTMFVARENVNTGRFAGLQVSGTGMKYWAPTDGGVQFNNTTNSFTGSVKASTNENWPTSLPGTAVGTIPNL